MAAAKRRTRNDDAGLRDLSGFSVAAIEGELAKRGRRAVRRVRRELHGGRDVAPARIRDLHPVRAAASRPEPAAAATG